MPARPSSTFSTAPQTRRRDTAWKRDGRIRGVYWRRRANGTKSWGYYADGRITSAPSRQAALDEKAKASLRKSAELPAPDTRVLIRDLAEEVRESKRRKLATSSFAAFEYALDKIILPELGHLKPGACGPDRLARLIRDLEERGLAPSSIRRYLSPLSAIFKLALRRGVIPSSPLALLSDDERPTGGGVREHYIWSPKEIADLIAAADALGRRPTAQYDYGPLVRLLVLTGLRVSEALALRVQDIDLVGGELHVRSSLGRNGQVKNPKTEAGRRTVPLSPGLVDSLVRAIPEGGDPEGFVFHARGNLRRPLSYWNFRRRGFGPALEAAGLSGKGITIHSLRSAAISLYAARRLTMLETATVMGQKDPSVTWKHYARQFDPARCTRSRARCPGVNRGSLIEEPIDPGLLRDARREARRAIADGLTAEAFAKRYVEETISLMRQVWLGGADGVPALEGPPELERSRDEYLLEFGRIVAEFLTQLGYRWHDSSFEDETTSRSRDPASKVVMSPSPLPG